MKTKDFSTLFAKIAAINECEKMGKEWFTVREYAEAQGVSIRTSLDHLKKGARNNILESRRVKAKSGNSIVWVTYYKEK